jgi:excisionase family DNA binding protein
MQRFLRITEIADMLAVNRLTIWRLIKLGELPAYRVGKVFRVSDADLAAWMISHSNTSAGEADRELTARGV